MGGKEVWISNATDCEIAIADRIGAARMDKIVNCKIYLGPVAGSILIESATNCTLIVASRQVRPLQIALHK